jgi:hypothetical protein
VDGIGIEIGGSDMENFTDFGMIATQS